jgi:hypothetical protein
VAVVFVRRDVAIVFTQLCVAVVFVRHCVVVVFGCARDQQGLRGSPRCQSWRVEGGIHAKLSNASVTMPCWAEN